jgi:DNA-binding beta-propeller fold protein YncE
MHVVVSSANGSGFGAVLAFEAERATDFATIEDPRGLHIHPAGAHLYVNSGNDRVVLVDATGTVTAATSSIAGLNPGGGVVALDGRYCVGSRTMRTIIAFPSDLHGSGEQLFPQNLVEFPRGFAFAADGRVYLASGAAATEARGRILVGAPHRKLDVFVDDPELSPLDLTLAPNGNVLVSSEYPFGSPSARSTVREYDVRSGALVRVFAPDSSVSFRNPRGLRFSPDGQLCCVARDEVVAFDFEQGRCLGALVRLEKLNGQALEFFPRLQ